MTFIRHYNIRHLLFIFFCQFIFSACRTALKIPLDKQGGCTYDPKNGGYSEWFMKFDQYPKLLNDSTENLYFKKNLHFSQNMIKHEIAGRIMIKSYISTRGKLFDFRVYVKGDYVNGYTCLDCNTKEIIEINKDCKKEAIRLLKGMKFSPAILKNKKVIKEMLHNVNFYYSDYVKGEYSDN